MWLIFDCANSINNLDKARREIIIVLLHLHQLILELLSSGRNFSQCNNSMAHRRFKSWLTAKVKSDASASPIDSGTSHTVTDGSPTPRNVTMMQGFEWYVPADQKHWRRLQAQIPQLKAWGIDNIWIPPAYEYLPPFKVQTNLEHSCKAATKDSNGYDVYDLFVNL